MDTFDPNNPYNYYAEEANRRAQAAQFELENCRRELSSAQLSQQANVQQMMLLHDRLRQVAQELEQTRQANQALEADNLRLQKLLEAPLGEIAAAHPGFGAKYEEEQKRLAKWIWSEKAYRETAMLISAEAGKTTEEFTALYQQSTKAVMNDTTVHGNNASGNAILSQYQLRPKG